MSFAGFEAENRSSPIRGFIVYEKIHLYSGFLFTIFTIRQQQGDTFALYLQNCQYARDGIKSWQLFFPLTLK